MVTIGMNYKTLPGKQAEFVGVFRAVLAAILDAEGHQDSKLFQDVDDDQSFLIVSNWSQREAFQAFIKSQAFADVTGFAKENLLAERPVHKVYER